MIICKVKPFTLERGWCDGATQCADPPAQRFKIVVLFPVICIFTLMYLVFFVIGLITIINLTLFFLK